MLAGEYYDSIMEPDSTVQSLGGQARAQKLTHQRRAEIARRAAEARWAKGGPTIAAHYGAPDRPLRIGEIEIPCYVLSDGTRLLAQRGLQSGIGMSEGGGQSGERKIAAFMARLAEKGIDVRGLVARANSPIRFVPPHGGNPADGYEATILPDICAVVIEADQKGKLDKRLKRLAERAATLQHGFATVGIIALVDEATGYQEIRDRDALQQILDRYIGRELAKWAERFPKTFYEQMFRLKGWTYNPSSSKRPLQMARMTVDLVFDRLGPGLTNDLRARRDEIQESTGRTGKLHQVLTPDVGHPALAHHLAGLEFTAKTFQDGDYEGFHRAVERAAPKYNSTRLLPFPDEDASAADQEIHR
ncbi:MAG: P63C domain-containing protein [Bryobacteraceae bacterium]|jgi:hypothetical protein